MFFLYNILLTIGFIVLLPRFALDAVFSGKYAGGFFQRLGFIATIDPKGKKVVWIHCVSVGETNAARPLIERIHDENPDLSIVVSTTTKTGQRLARSLFANTADLVFYFPFDWKSTVRRALSRVDPALVLLIETEIWFNFIRETNKHHTKLAIVNGRLSERSFERFSYITKFMHRVLSYIDLALMQDKADARRIMALGLRGSRVRVTGNIKFDHPLTSTETELTADLRRRFDIRPEAPLIIAASTHQPEERVLLEAFRQVWKSSPDRLPRLVIAPRHPERFAEVADLIKISGFNWVRRTENESARDHTAEVILLDTIGELRAAYPLAELVFVGGSLIPHGGQSIFEPAAAGRAIITGPFTANFSAAVSEFLDREAIVQLPVLSAGQLVPKLASVISSLLSDRPRTAMLGENALKVIKSNSGAVSRTLEYLEPMLQGLRSR
mgnify:CR=1 FL=1